MSRLGVFTMTIPEFLASSLAEERSATACFTGHRRLPPALADRIAERTTHVIRVLAAAGYRNFLCGGALGYDTLAEQCVVEAREENPAIRLILALPCRNQTEKWMRIPEGRDALREYQRLKGLADAVVYVRDFYADGCMRERNRFMVDCSSFLTAYCNASEHHSGAGQTLRMAERAGLKIYNIREILGIRE